MKRSPYQFWFDRGSQLVTNLEQAQTEMVEKLDHDQFELGDWVNEGREAGYIKDYREASKKLNGRVKPSTLKVYAWVAKKFSVIRITGLSFAHHQLLARIPQESRADLAEKAKQNDWSVSRLRTEVRKIGKRKQESDGDEGARRRLAQAKANIKKLAKFRGLPHLCVMVEVYESYLSLPAVKEELRLIARESWERNGFRQMWRDRQREIDELCERMPDADAEQIVRTYESEYGEKFPFEYAMSRTSFGDRFHGLTKEDCHCGEFSEFDPEQTLERQIEKAEALAEAEQAKDTP